MVERPSSPNELKKDQLRKGEPPVKLIHRRYPVVGPAGRGTIVASSCASCSAFSTDDRSIYHNRSNLVDTFVISLLVTVPKNNMMHAEAVNMARGKCWGCESDSGGWERVGEGWFTKTMDAVRRVESIGE